MNYKYLFYGLILFFFSCDVQNQQDENRIKLTKENRATFTAAFLDVAINDTLSISNEVGGLCFNYDLDSLAKNFGRDEEMLYQIRLVDLSNSIILLSWHPFIGDLKVSKITATKYEFVGYARLPETGNWDDGFQEHTLIKYILELDGSNYKFYRDKTVKLNLKSSNSELLRLQNHINNTPNCKSDNWNISDSCFLEIEQYQHQLFLALLEGKIAYKETYLNLRNDISIVNAGEFSQHLEGSYLILALYGIINKEEYDLSRILFLNELYLDKKGCY